MDVELLQQSFPECRAGTAFEQDIVGEHDSGSAVDVENRFDVLNKVDLLVGGGNPEVVPDDLQRVLLGSAIFAHHLHRGLGAERWVGQHDRPAFAGVSGESVFDLDRARAVSSTHAVQQHVHRCQPGRTVNQFDALHEPFSKVCFLVGGEVLGFLAGVLVSGKQEPAGAASRVGDRVINGGFDTVDHRRDH